MKYSQNKIYDYEDVTDAIYAQVDPHDRYFLGDGSDINDMMNIWFSEKNSFTLAELEIAVMYAEDLKDKIIIERQNNLK